MNQIKTINQQALKDTIDKSLKFKELIRIGIDVEEAAKQTNVKLAKINLI